MKNSAALFLIILWVISSCSDHKIVITGTIEEIENPKLYLYEINPDGKQLLDSTYLTNHDFKFTLSTKKRENPDDPAFYRLSQNQFNEINTIARAGENIHFDIHEKKMVNSYHVSGGEDAILMWELDRKLKLFIDMVEKMYQVYELNMYDDDFKEKLDADYMTLVKHHQDELLLFIEEHIHSFVSLPAFYQSYNRRIFITEDEHLDLLQRIYFSLSEQYPQHPDVLYLAERLNKKNGRK